MNEKLKTLYNELLMEGCNKFYIRDVGGGYSSPDGIDMLDYIDNKWCVYYTERGLKHKPIFSSESLDDAIAFYRNHILSIQHWHLIVFSRSKKTIEYYKNKISAEGIEVRQNDIPHYSQVNDRVFRLFVLNKDIFRVREIFQTIPFMDDDLKDKN
jgi:hypothetical protein